MASYGAYYYSSSKPEPRSDTPSRNEEVRSPAPSSRYTDRPRTASTTQFQRRRSITPPDGERRPYYNMDRPRNPGSTEERGATAAYGERTTTVPPHTPSAYTPPPRPPERKRAESPDPSIFSELSEPEIKPNYSVVDYYTYTKCLERVIADPNLAMPVRLGIIGKWGAGKSKIMKGVLWCLKQACDFTCSHLSEPVKAPRTVNWIYRTCICCDMSFFTYLSLLTLLMTVLIIVIVLAMLLGVAPFVVVDVVTSPANNTNYFAADNTSQESIALLVTVSLVAFFLLLLCIAGICKCTKDRYLRDTLELLSHVKVFIIMALCDVPPPPQDTVTKVEMIPVCFNANEHLGSEDPSCAITEHLISQCELMFGFWKSRFYRVCDNDLDHEHDYLIADEDKWKHSTADKTTGLRATRSLASAMPNHQAKPKELANMLKANKPPTVSNGKATSIKNRNKPLQHKTSLRSKSNKVVATEEMGNLQVDVPVHVAKWRRIGYPMLITIVLTLMVTAVVVIVTISRGIDTTKTQTYHYVILAIASIIIIIPILMQVKNAIRLLFNVCSDPAMRLQRLRMKQREKRHKRTSSESLIHEAKKEVVILMGFIRYMEHLYQRRFRLLLTIDDLDKCPHQTILNVLNAIEVLFGDPSFPIVVMMGIDSDLVSSRLSKLGIESGRKYISQYMNMRFCIPDSTQHDIVKLLECQAEHLLCSTSVRVNRLKEVADRKHKTAEYRSSREESIRQLDTQHDYEERTKHTELHDGYYSHPVSARHIATARSRHTKSSKSKKRVVFTPLKTASEDGLEDPTPQPNKVVAAAPQTIDKSVVPPVNKVEISTSPNESRKHSLLTAERRPGTADRPDSQLSRVKSPLALAKNDMRRENSMLAEESSDEETEELEPDWMLAMTAGESRKDSTKGAISTRRPQLTESEKTEEQLAEQHIHDVAEMKVLLGVSQGLITALVTNPSYEIAVSYDDGLGKIKNLPGVVSLQNISREQLKRHILAYGLRRRMVYLALDEVRHSIKLLDSNFTRMTQLFNSVYLSVYIWVQKLKQLGVVEAILDEKESDKAIVKLVRTCQELSRWIMICELWPYRASWLIYKVERVNRKMGDFPSSSFYLEASIRDIYKDIRPDVRGAKDEFSEWNVADYSDAAFKKSLEKFKDISGNSVLRYLPFTINIDRSYKNSIASYMAAGGAGVSTRDEDVAAAPKTISFAEPADTNQQYE